MEISILKQKAELSINVSVVVPLGDRDKRWYFFNNYVLPLIKANNPAEIIIVHGHGGACEKRNIGLQKATCDYVFFCDDDILLPAQHLSVLLKEIKSRSKKVAYCYTGYRGVVNDINHPMKRNFVIPGLPFNENQLKNDNYISTMSLIDRGVLVSSKVKFDESLGRFQDWDLWLQLLSKGYSGSLCDKSEFMAFYNDEGITSKKNDAAKSRKIIEVKHSLK